VEFGKRFRFLREQICGLPEAGGRDPFAEAIEVNRKTVEKWESKKQDNIPNGETLRRIVKTFEKPEINLNWLLTGDGEPYPKHIIRRGLFYHVVFEFKDWFLSPRATFENIYCSPPQF